MAELSEAAELRVKLAAVEQELAEMRARALAAEAELRSLKAGQGPTLAACAEEGFTPLKSYRSTAADGRADAVVVVDPISTGARLAKMAMDRGFAVLRVYSALFPQELKDLVPESCAGLRYEATLTFADAQATIDELKELPYHVAAVLIGCEAGVECCDELTSAMHGFPTNGLEKSAARRDKWLMGEEVRAAGLRAVRQLSCGAWVDALPFIQELGVVPGAEASPESGWCVLKPTKSAGTDGVFIAKDLEEAERRFSEIIGKNNVFGDQNDCVLVQEFLKGKEYVIDSVSVEGQHKCVALWEYDKRRANGAQFVYFGMKLYQTEDGVREQRLVEYVHGVLDALGVRHGPSHAEVIWVEGDGPCLVEVGCRPHGGEGTFVDMVEPVIGYSKLSVMIDAIEKPYRFHRLPTRPERFAGGATEVCLVCYQDGQLMGYPGVERIKELPSFQSIELKNKPGDSVSKTVDFLTTPGSVMLVHEDGRQVEEDMAFIHELEKDGLYNIKPIGSSELRMRSF